MELSQDSKNKETLPECPESGLPVCLTSTKIVGRGEYLKKLRHPNLQSLVDVESSNQERIVFVSEKPSQPSLFEVNGKLGKDERMRFAQMLFSAINFLHGEGLVHGQERERKDGSIDRFDFRLIKFSCIAGG